MQTEAIQLLPESARTVGGFHPDVKPEPGRGCRKARRGASRNMDIADRGWISFTASNRTSSDARSRMETATLYRPAHIFRQHSRLNWGATKNHVKQAGINRIRRVSTSRLAQRQIQANIARRTPRRKVAYATHSLRTAVTMRQKVLRLSCFAIRPEDPVIRSNPYAQSTVPAARAAYDDGLAHSVPALAALRTLGMGTL